MVHPFLEIRTMLSPSYIVTFPTAWQQKPKVGFGCGWKMLVRVCKLPAINTEGATDLNPTPVMVGFHRKPPEPFKRFASPDVYRSRLNVSSTPLRLIVGHMNIIPIISGHIRYLDCYVSLEKDLKPVG